MLCSMKGRTSRTEAAKNGKQQLFLGRLCVLLFGQCATEGLLWRSVIRLWVHRGGMTEGSRPEERSNISRCSVPLSFCNACFVP